MKSIKYIPLVLAVIIFSCSKKAEVDDTMVDENLSNRFYDTVAVDSFSAGATVFNVTKKLDSAGDSINKRADKQDASLAEKTKQENDKAKKEAVEKLKKKVDEAKKIKEESKSNDSKNLEPVEKKVEELKNTIEN